MAWAKLWPDWIIRINITINIFTSFQLWADKPFCEMGCWKLRPRWVAFFMAVLQCSLSTTWADLLLGAPVIVIHGMWPFIWRALGFMEHSSVTTCYSYPWDVAFYLAGSGLHGALFCDHLLQLSMGCGHLSDGLWASWSTLLWPPVTVIHGMWPFIWRALGFMEHSSVSSCYSYPWDVIIYLAGSGLHGALFCDHLLQLSMGCGHLSGRLWASWSTLLWAPVTVIHGMWSFIWQALGFMEHSSVSSCYSYPWDVAIYLAGPGLHGALLISLTYSLWRDLVPQCEYSTISCVNELIDLACGYLASYCYWCNTTLLLAYHQWKITGGFYLDPLGCSTDSGKFT